ncbi:Peptide G protein-coupled receptor [Fasciola gigantica]|uniref:Peptide G protein-coupled receptor n=1 Tax=Fasciola gigantica TaxID=46835 RepID=A0A504YHP3_FASGI|nr:Peptide G protein-coupled receptor [Fasciola gigantica]
MSNQSNFSYVKIPTPSAAVRYRMNFTTRYPTTVDRDSLIRIIQKYNNALENKPHKKVLLTFYIIIVILGILINVLLVHTIHKLRNPKSLSNRRMMITRVICDLALVLFVVPHSAYTAIYPNWLLGSAMCKISAFTMLFIVALSNFLLVAICLNRSVAISQNDKSPTDPTTNVPCRVKCLLCAAVTAAFSIALPGAMVIREDLLTYKLEPWIEQYNLSHILPKICQETWSREAQVTYDVVLIVAIYLLPLFVVCVSQHVVTLHLRQSQRLLVLMGHQHTLAWTRRRQRLTRLCVLMAALFVFSWSPTHVCNLLNKAFHVQHPSIEILLDFSMVLAMSNAVTGPILLIATCSVYHRYVMRVLTRFSCRSRGVRRAPGVHTTSMHSSISLCTPGSNRHEQVKNEVSPHVMHSVTNNFGKTIIE